MTSYIGILEKEAGTLWGVWFPDLPGCIAAAPTSGEVIEQVGPALAQWIEQMLISGNTPPPPRTIEEIRQDAWVIEALAKGDVPVVVPVPVVPEDLGLDEKALQAIDAEAGRRGLSRLGFVRETVLEKIAG
jgi:predicted RNase H-like HicB family nuclease